MTTQATKRLENYKLIGLTREGDRVVRGHYYLQLIATDDARKNASDDLATMVVESATNRIVSMHNADEFIASALYR
jgi:hypothetical protein